MPEISPRHDDDKSNRIIHSVCPPWKGIGAMASNRWVISCRKPSQLNKAGAPKPMQSVAVHPADRRLSRSHNETAY
jgi:hypothetical protein